MASLEEQRINLNDDAAMPEAVVEQTVEDKSSTYRSHREHRSEEGRRHSHSHRSGKSRKKKRKIKLFIKKHKTKILNILALILAVGACVFIASQNPHLNDKPADGTPQNTEDLQQEDLVTEASIQIEIPLFSDDVFLITEPANAFQSRDMSMPANEMIGRYKESEERLDIGLPVTIDFDVKGLPVEYTITASTVEVSEDAAFTDSRVYRLGMNQRSVDVFYLKTDTQYHYRISITLSNRSVVAVQGTFQTADTPRILSVEGLVNVRDIGGWETVDGKNIRQGLLYRGSELDGAVQPSFSISENGKNDMLTIFGIRTDMDLRAPTDNVYGIDPLGANVEHIYYDAPMYVGAFTNTGAVRAVFADLADETKYPVYLHCTYGRDRTGTICYLLEALLGVGKEDLMRDYDLTALYYGGVESGQMADFVARLETFEGTTMQEKVENYLLSIGVTQQEIASIRRIFLEG